LDGEVYESDVAGRTKTARRHLAIVERFAPVGRLLDVGCASGLFLRCAARRGWAVVGVEPSLTLCGSARETLADKGEVICATLEDSALPPTSFDAVTLWDVLEHVPDPVDFMRCASRLLKPGGFLFANVPDLDSVQARVFGSRWPLFLQEHLGYFNPSSLDLCGQSAGVQRVRFGRRTASFSVGYVLYRLAQHGIPGAALGHALVRRLGAGAILISIPLGELYGVWRCPAAA